MQLAQRCARPASIQAGSVHIQHSIIHRPLRAAAANKQAQDRRMNRQAWQAWQPGCLAAAAISAARAEQIHLIQKTKNEIPRLDSRIADLYLPPVGQVRVTSLQ
jgi:hypothetical protein